MKLTEENLAEIERHAICLLPAEIEALVAEVRRLRAKVAALERKIEADEGSDWERSEHK